MDGLEIFKKLKDTCDEVVKAYENKNEGEIEVTLGKFMLLMVQLDCLK